MATKAKSIQFFDAETSLDVFKGLGMPDFAIWHDNQLMFPHESETMEESIEVLSNYLDNLSSSPVIYTLRVYKIVPDSGITDKAPYSGSFNFRLLEPDSVGRQFGYRTPAIGGTGNYNHALESRVEALTLAVEQMNERLNGDEPAEDPKQGLGQITAFLDHPLVQLLTNKILGVMQPQQQQQQEQRRPSIGNINQQAPAAADNGILPLDQSIKILRASDPNLDEHLYKLALLSQQNPESFNFLLQTIDRM